MWPMRAVLGQSGGLPGSPRAPGDEKSMGKKLVTVPGPDSAVSGAGRSKRPPKIFGKGRKFFGSGTGREIVVFRASGARVKTPGAEKHRENAYNGPGPRFP